MSRVEKGGRSFRPVVKGSAIRKPPTAVQPASSQAPQCVSSTSLSAPSASQLGASNPPTTSSATNCSAPEKGITTPAPRTSPVPTPDAPRLIQSLTPISSVTTSTPLTTSLEFSQPESSATVPSPVTSAPLPVAALRNESQSASHTSSTTRPDLPPENEDPPQSRYVRASSVMSSCSVSTSGLSAAEKMKLKAQAAKAARAEQKLRHPTPSRRSASLTPSISSVDNSTRPESRDIPVPSLSQHTPRRTSGSLMSRSSSSSTSILAPGRGSSSGNQMGEIAQFLEESLASESIPGGTTIAGDIPVQVRATASDSSVQSARQSSQAPSLISANASQRNPKPPETKAPPCPSTKSRRKRQVSPSLDHSDDLISKKEVPVQPIPKARQKSTKAVPDSESVDSQPAPDGTNTDDEDISPRLKRKRHLVKLRAEKQGPRPTRQAKTAAVKSNAAIALFNPSSGEEDDGDEYQDEDAAESSRRSRSSTQDLESRPQKQKRTISPRARAAKPTASGVRKRKAIKRKKENRAGSQAPDNASSRDELEAEESASDTPIDAMKVKMNVLCAHERGKGRGSEVLSKRMKLVIERRDREKAERLMARETEKQKRRTPVVRRSLPRDDGEQDDEDARDGSTAAGGSVRGASEQPTNETTQASADAKALMESLGLEELDSDDDMDNFEEVVFDEFASSRGSKSKQTAKSAVPAADVLPDIEEEEEEVVEEDYVPEATQYAPQLRVVDGQIILDQDSLQVDRQDQTSRLDEMEIVEENDSTRLVNSHTWGKGVRGERWSAEETSLFFDAVRMFGSDFEMIAQLFPGRSRKQIRLKWIKEEKKAPKLMTDVMMGRRPSRTSVAPSTPEEEAEGADDGDACTDLLGCTSLNTFSEYAQLVGIDTSLPILEDPMDKWREKERLEDEEMRKVQQHAAKDKGDAENDDEDEDEEVEEVTVAWGEQ